MSLAVQLDESEGLLEELEEALITSGSRRLHSCSHPSPVLPAAASVPSSCGAVVRLFSG